MSIISLKSVVKRFGTHTILDELNLEVEEGEFLAIIGRSGEGKSVLLKHVVGLIQPDSGSVIVNGIDISDQNSDFMAPGQVNTCGYVFQFAALLDSLTVFENIGIFELENGLSPYKIRPIIVEKIKSVGLKEDILSKYPNELSGGMKKRVGLARTLMQSPKVIIYDEPTTGLDPISSNLIHDLMKKTHDERKITSIVISHNLDIFKYATQVAMLYKGKILYKGPAATIWDCDNPYIHQFIRGLAEGPLEQTV